MVQLIDEFLRPGLFLRVFRGLNKRSKILRKAVAAYRQHYGESGYLGSVPFPGIGKSLEEMKQTGLRIYLATSKRANFASRILDHLKFATYFDGIYSNLQARTATFKQTA
jgi:phosphoglycolate phosphatase-like HAD superfamily hydrolase